MRSLDRRAGKRRIRRSLLAVVGAGALALGGFALAATPQPSISSVHLTPGQTVDRRTITVSGLRLGRVTSVSDGTLELRFRIVSPRKIVIFVPAGKNVTRVQIAFAKITQVWTSGCQNCGDDWSFSG
jgi:hypothetical protein